MNFVKWFIAKLQVTIKRYLGYAKPKKAYFTIVFEDYDP
jgi:hypothetical protein